MENRFKFVCVAMMLLITCSSQADNTRQLPFKHYTSDDGMSQDFLSSLLKSKNGYVWFGTQSGLNRFDGYEFKVFKHQPENDNSLSNNIIHALAQDKNGFIWIATGRGLSRFNPNNQSFTNFYHHPDDPSSISSNRPSVLFIDSRERLWIGTFDNGLNRFDAQSNQFIRYGHNESNSSLSSDVIRAIAQDDKHRLWIGTAKATNDVLMDATGLHHMDLETEEITRIMRSSFPQAIFSSVLSLMFDQGRLFIGSWRNGLFEYGASNSQFTAIEAGFSGSNIEINAIEPAQSNGLWLGTRRRGLFYFNTDTKKTVKISSAKNSKFELNKQPIKALINQDNQLWIATRGAGLHKLNLSSQQFNWLIHQQGSPSIPDDGMVLSVAQDKDGGLWMAGLNHGVFYWHKQGNVFKTYQAFPGMDTKFSNFAVQSVEVDGNDNVWVGTQKNGLYRWDRATNQVTHYGYEVTDSEGIGGNSIRSIVDSQDGNLWLAVNHKGLDKLNIASGKFEHFNQDSGVAGIVSTQFTLNSMFLAQDNSLWLGTVDQGAIHFKPTTKTATNYHKSDTNNSIPNNYVTSFVQDSVGNIWLSSDGGITKLTFKGENTAFSNFDSTSHGLKDNTVSSLQIDSSGSLWLGVVNDLIEFNPFSERFSTIGRYEGSNPGAYIDGASYKDKQGVMYFAGLGGMVYFHPQSIASQSALVAPRITEFYLNNRPISADSAPLQSGAIIQGAPLTLNHAQNNFGFSFAAMDYRDPSQVAYRYRMVGFDQQWLMTDAENRRATYTNLDAGHYQFEVSAKTDQQWSEPASVTIIIVAAPWKTWWAYGIYFLLAFIIVGSFIWQRYKIHQALKRHAQLVELNNEQLSLTSKLFENTSEAVWVLDHDLRYLTVNKSFEEVTGYSSEQVIGRLIHFSQVHNQSASFRDDVFKRVAQSKRWSDQIWEERQNGEVYPVEVVIDKVMIFDNNGDYIDHQYIGIFTDITQKRRAEEDLRQLAHFDSLTKLANRAQFQTLVKATIARNQQMLGSEFIILFLDLDNFKSINDSLGHSPGDKVLLSIAEKLSNFAKQPITVARLGGDEFGLLIPPEIINYDVSRFAAHFIEALLANVRHKIEIEGFNFNISASVGAVIYPNDGTTYEELLRNADTAMYNAKNSGRDNCRFYSDEMNKNARQRLDYENQLANAINKDELFAYFQPKADLQTGEIVGAEVLARWHNEKFGWVRPDIFIALAEETGEISAISDHLLRQACRVVLPLIEQGLFKGRMAFNLSAVQFQDSDFLDKIDNILKDCRFPSKHLELEVTESLMMDDVGRSIGLMKALQRRGISIALDDFGTGYSSLSYLKQFPIDVLKIDRSFIIDIAKVSQDRNMVESIIDLSHNLDMKVVAEGGEEKDQIELLKMLSCDVLQGYYLSKPLSEKEYVVFLSERENLYQLTH